MVKYFESLNIRASLRMQRGTPAYLYRAKEELLIDKRRIVNQNKRKELFLSNTIAMYEKQQEKELNYLSNKEKFFKNRQSKLIDLQIKTTLNQPVSIKTTISDSMNDIYGKGKNSRIENHIARREVISRSPILKSRIKVSTRPESRTDCKVSASSLHSHIHLSQRTPQKFCRTRRRRSLSCPPILTSQHPRYDKISNEPVFTAKVSIYWKLIKDNLPFLIKKLKEETSKEFEVAYMKSRGCTYIRFTKEQLVEHIRCHKAKCFCSTCSKK